MITNGTQLTWESKDCNQTTGYVKYRRRHITIICFILVSDSNRCVPKRTRATASLLRRLYVKTVAHVSPMLLALRVIHVFVPTHSRVLLVKLLHVSCEKLALLKMQMTNSAFEYSVQLVDNSQFCYSMSTDAKPMTWQQGTEYCQQGGADSLAVIQLADEHIALRGTS